MSGVQCDSVIKANCRVLRYRGYALEHFLTVFICEATELSSRIFLPFCCCCPSPDHMRNPCCRKLRKRHSADEKQGNEP